MLPTGGLGRGGLGSPALGGSVVRFGPHTGGGGRQALNQG